MIRTMIWTMMLGAAMIQNPAAAKDLEPGQRLFPGFERNNKPAAPQTTPGDMGAHMPFLDTVALKDAIEARDTAQIEDAVTKLEERAIQVRIESPSRATVIASRNAIDILMQIRMSVRGNDFSRASELASGLDAITIASDPHECLACGMG